MLPAAFWLLFLVLKGTWGPKGQPLHDLDLIWPEVTLLLDLTWVVVTCERNGFCVGECVWWARKIRSKRLALSFVQKV